MRLAVLLTAALAMAACARAERGTTLRGTARNLVIVTIDTLRADRLGAYGYPGARTPVIDGLAARGARFTRAYATAPITLTSHASLMTGLIPPGHGARHNGMRVEGSVRTLAEQLSAAGFATGAFVAAFPLDRRFGLNKGFDAYGDALPRAAHGRPANERPARAVVDEAITWLGTQRSRRFFLWVHLFEPHAPYGNPADGRPAAARYDDEVAESDRQIGRLMAALQQDLEATLVVVTSDHGEAFGEHGETGHSIFVYDTTLQVPLVMAGPALTAAVVDEQVSLIDVAPTVLELLGAAPLDADGVDLTPTLTGTARDERELYAESFAPLLDFGWSPLRSLRTGRLKYISAPRAELYNLAADPGEHVNLAERQMERVAAFAKQVDRLSPPSLDAKPAGDPEALGRLQSLGYASGSPAANQARPDPKDRRELAARIASVTSGELSGAALEATLRAILSEDPQNPQAHLRLGFVLVETNRCGEAEEHFRAAIAAKVPTAEAHLGLAGCYAAARKFDRAAAVLGEGAKVEPDNPVVVANQGVLLSDSGKPAAAVPLLQQALAIDPEFHEARFNLAIAYARANRRSEAAEEARTLLARLPANAPQRSEVERLLAAVR